MLDVNVIRSNPDMIRTMLKNRNKDDAILDRFLAADSEWRALTDENNRLRKVRNDVSLQISKMPKGEEKDARIKEMREVSDKIKANDDRMAELEEVRQDCVLNIPNIPHESVPIGKDEHDNVVVYEKGEKRKFDFKPKEHGRSPRTWTSSISTGPSRSPEAGSTASRATEPGSRGLSSTISWTHTWTRGTRSCSRRSWSTRRPSSEPDSTPT